MTNITRLDPAGNGQVEGDEKFTPISNVGDPAAWRQFAVDLKLVYLDGRLPILDFTALDYELSAELRRHAWAHITHGPDKHKLVKLRDGTEVEKFVIWTEVVEFIDNDGPTTVRRFLECLASVRDDLASFAESHANAVEWCQAEDAAKNAEVKTS